MPRMIAAPLPQDQTGRGGPDSQSPGAPDSPGRHKTYRAGAAPAPPKRPRMVLGHHGPVPLIDVAIDTVGVVRHPQLLHEPASKPHSVVSLLEHATGRRTLFCRQAGDMVVCMAYLERQPSRLVLWVAVLTALTAVVSLAMAITTLPHSGPYCRSDCVGYPYSDAAAFVPRDYLWMYPALVLTLLAVVLMESIHHQLALSRGLLSRIAVAFTTMGAAILVVDYARSAHLPPAGIAAR